MSKDGASDMKPKPTQKKEKDPEVLLKIALSLTQCAPRADIGEIEKAIRAYGKAFAKQRFAVRISKM